MNQQRSKHTRYPPREELVQELDCMGVATELIPWWLDEVELMKRLDDLDKLNQINGSDRLELIHGYIRHVGMEVRMRK
jgi:hypothetical protein